MGKDLRFRIADSAQEVEAIHRLNYRTFVLEIPQHPRNADERSGFLPFGPVVGHDGAWFQPMCLTFDFLLRTDVDAPQATILTPFPGTPLHAEMECQGRITDRDWSHCDFRHVVFEPKHMSAADLKAGHDRVLAGFYSWRNSAARFVREIVYLPLGLIAKAAIPLNVSYRVRLTADGTMH
jgi:hypothetical protein